MEDGVLLEVDPTVALSEHVKSTLNTYEDYVNRFIQLHDAVNAASWIKADLFLHMSEKLGDGSISKISGDLAIPLSTITNYIRTAVAFPPHTRNPMVTFTHHMQATFADAFDRTDRKFITNRRFDWIDKSADDNLSVKTLSNKIQEQKNREESQTDFVTCDHCGGCDSRVKSFTLRENSAHKKSITFYIHEECYLAILEFIYASKKNN